MKRARLHDFQFGYVPNMTRIPHDYFVISAVLKCQNKIMVIQVRGTFDLPQLQSLRGN